MYNPLGMLVVVFIAMTVISILGLVLMFVFKDERKQRVVFYFLTAIGMLLAYYNAKSTPATNAYMIEIIRGWVFGTMSAAALLLQLCGKKENSFKIAKLLVAISVVAGMMETFAI